MSESPPPWGGGGERGGGVGGGGNGRGWRGGRYGRRRSKGSELRRAMVVVVSLTRKRRLDWKSWMTDGPCWYKSYRSSGSKERKSDNGVPELEKSVEKGTRTRGIE